MGELDDLSTPGLDRAVDVAGRLQLARAKRRADPFEIERLERELQDRIDDMTWAARYPR